MDAEQETRAFVEGAFVIADARAIRGAHFAQHGAAFGHDVRNAEAIADFDQLAARNNHLCPLREGVQDQENSGGVVVDDNRSLSPNELRQQPGRVDVALAALAPFEVVFEVRVTRSDEGDFSLNCSGNRRPPQIRMQNHAGGVDHGDERWREQGFDALRDARFDRGGIECVGDSARGTGGYRIVLELVT